MTQSVSPPALGSAGRRLWADLARDSDPFSIGVMVVEACRIADRLEKLDSLLRGDVDVWARLVHRTQTDDYELKVDNALRHAGQQSSVLRQLLSEIRRQRGPEESAGGDDDDLAGL